jgi:hypothetical protein
MLPPENIASLDAEEAKLKVVLALLDFRAKVIQETFESMTADEIVEAIENYCKKPKLIAVFKALIELPSMFDIVQDMISDTTGR